MLLQANAVQIPLADKTCHVCVTSPPYWSLRDYNLPPTIWGGSAMCDHQWQSMTHKPQQHGDNGRTSSGLDGGTANQAETRLGAITSGTCRLCGAWLGCLGLEPTPDLYVEHLVAVFREVRRVLRDDGTLWLNLGDSYSGNSGGGFRAGAGRADGIVDERNQRNRNGNGCPPGLKPKDLVGIPWMVAFALRADGWYLRSDIIWAKKAPMPESVTDRPTRSHEYLFLLSKRPRYYYDADAIVEQSTGQNGQAADFKRTTKDHLLPGQNTIQHREERESTYDTGTRNKRDVWLLGPESFSGSHFAVMPTDLVEPCILAGTSARGCCPRCKAPYKRVTQRTSQSADSERDYQGVPEDQPNRNHRQEPKKRGAVGTPTVEDQGWIPGCDCDAGEPVPATVLDCFSGSGTTGMVAQKHGRNYVGLDLSPTYLHELAPDRMDVQAYLPGADLGLPERKKK